MGRSVLRGARAAYLILLVSVAGALLGGTASAQPTVATRAADVEATERMGLLQMRAPPPATPTEKLARENWRRSLALRPTPHGCSTAVYPSLVWRPVACVRPPLRPSVPANGVRPEIIGNNNDFAAVVSGTLTSAEGKFDSITGMTSESNADVENLGAPTGSNKYTLQLNTNTFGAAKCAQATTPSSCTGWEQFVFSQTYGMYIQYWLINYGSNCPANFTFYNNGGQLDCYRNGDNGFGIGSGSGNVPSQPLSNLANMSITASAGQGSADDKYVLSDGSQAWTDSEDNSILGLNAHWTTAEFNIFGDCCGSQAQFNSGTAIQVRTIVHNGTTNAPTCAAEGFTGETNNLNLVATPAIAIGASPAVAFNQSSATGSAACATASSTGDTHVVTFTGTLYDFQATGDFILTQAGDFTVQTRQIVGPPSYPDTAVNKAVAVRMSGQRMVLFMQPTALTVNGVERNLADGATLSVSPDVFVSRHGDTFFMRDRRGNSVRATVQPLWIDVSVGLGQNATASGLLGGPRTLLNTIVARDNERLTKPFAFNDLYHHYADSWRVQPAESLFVNHGVAVSGIPTKAIYAADLPPAERAQARAMCVNRGVQQALIDACTLDTVVLKAPEATARTFTRPMPPVRAEVRVEPSAVARLKAFKLAPAP
jgi:hypothetical protein